MIPPELLVSDHWSCDTRNGYWVGRAVIYLESLDIAYMAVPKAACSTVKTTLALLDPEHPLTDPKELAGFNPHDVYPTQRFRMKRWRQSKGAWRFTVVRDPVRRLLSAYTNRARDLRDLHNSPRLRAAGLPLDPDPDTFFENILAYQSLSSVIKHHTLPMVVFTGKHHGAFDRVFTTRELPALFRELSMRAKEPVTVLRANRSSGHLKLEDLSAASHAALRDLTRADYDVFKDRFEDPFR